MTWRSSLTRRFAGLYLAAPGYSEGNPFYRLTLTGEIDNPDQRICQARLCAAGRRGARRIDLERCAGCARVCWHCSSPGAGHSKDRAQPVSDICHSRLLESAPSAPQRFCRTFLNIVSFAAILYAISPAACYGVLVYAIGGTLVATKGFGPWLGFYQLQRVKQEAGLRQGLRTESQPGTSGHG